MKKPESKKKKFSFAVPQGFEPPPDLKDGEEFEALATLKLDGDRLELCEIDGAELAESAEGEDEPASDEPEDKDARRTRLTHAMSTSPGSPY